MKRLNERYGEWAVVTGASDGIGRAFAIELARAKLNIVLVARSEDRLKSLAKQLEEQFSIDTRVLPADLATQGGVETMLESVSSLDAGVFVAAAGYGTSGDFVANFVSAELDMLAVNCLAVMQQTHYFARHFSERGRGAIILLSSLVSFQGVPRAANYAASKAYIQCLSEGLRVELKAKNVDVLSVAPGPVNSGFAQRANMNIGAADTPEIVAKHALRALGKKFTVRPGFWGKLLGFSLAFTPRWGRIQIMQAVMRGMTNKQDQAADL